MSVTVNLTSSLWKSEGADEKGNVLHLRGTLWQSVTGLKKADTVTELSKLMASFNGFFALVEQRSDGLVAAVDHIRSIPLFYAYKSDAFYLSDDAEWVREQVDNEKMAHICRDEFLLSGYVTGSDTLYPDVKQLQAGEFIYFSDRARESMLTTKRYYRFQHVEPSEYSEVELRNRLECTFLNSMKRLVEYAAGRQIVLPLSGGYDSRLIAIYLKELNYDNLLTFTYGLSGNKEAEYSKDVASSLGLNWIFIEYSAELWRKEWGSEKAEQYRKLAANHTSLPHVQDWLAISKMVENNLISSDAIVVPGHTGDFISGGHIPKLVFERERHKVADLLDCLSSTHLSNAPKDDLSFENTEFSYKRLLSRLDGELSLNDEISSVEFANLYELWDWQERQAKYIVNSVKVYEQFNLDWWLPFWDLDFVRFWEDVPLILRKDRNWFIKWINEKYSSVSSFKNKKTLKNAGDPTLALKLLKFGSKILPASIRNRLKRKWNEKKLEKHLLGFDGIVTSGEIRDYSLNGYNIIGIYSHLYLNDKW